MMVWSIMGDDTGHAQVITDQSEERTSKMIEKTHETKYGTIHYWVQQEASHPELQLVFLPGLTADHRLFDQQIQAFAGEYPILVWDAPGHGKSRPFALEFSLADKAMWLEEILQKESFGRPVISGQSMGGYVAQAYSQLYPDRLAGLVSIDSAPLQLRYLNKKELAMLKHTELMYELYPWKSLLKSGSKGVATTEYGQKLMYDMMAQYGKKEYAKLAGHGFRILAEAIEMDLPYELYCQVLLICGEEDQAGYCKRYNREWHELTGYPIQWISDAGHNSNTDKPEVINGLIGDYMKTLLEKS